MRYKLCKDTVTSHCLRPCNFMPLSTFSNRMSQSPTPFHKVVGDLLKQNLEISLLSESLTKKKVDRMVVKNMSSSSRLCHKFTR